MTPYASFIISDFQAEPETEIPQTEAIQSAINAARDAGGGVVVVPPGTWTTGTIWLFDHVELHLSSGAVLQGSLEPKDYPRRQAVDEGIIVSRRAGPRRLVGAWQAKHVAVTGFGCIDGRGGCGGQINDVMGAEGHPQNLQFIDCQHVVVRDVRLRNAGSWMQVYNACRDVLIDGINVWNHGNFTNDGLDIDGCENVRVHNCYIDSHDDALVFKSTGPKACRHIQVTNCQLRSSCHGIKFGTESVGGFEYISVTNCSVRASSCDKPRPPITGVALECVDGGTMRHISISHLMVEEVYVPFFIKLGNRLDRRLNEAEADIPAGCIEDIHISRIMGTATGTLAPSITGYIDHPVKRVVISDCNILFEGGVTAEGILYDIPEKSDAYPEVHMLVRKDPENRRLPAYGCYLRDTEMVSFRHNHFRLKTPDARQSIFIERSQDIEVSGNR